MAEDIRISEAEWRVLEVLWDENPLTSTEVVERLQGETGWAPNTVRTLLSRLKDKGYTDTSTTDGKMYHVPKIARHACVRAESRSFLSRVFGGRPAPLLLHFAREAKLSPEELKELRAILDKRK